MTAGSSEGRGTIDRDHSSCLQLIIPHFNAPDSIGQGGLSMNNLLRPPPPPPAFGSMQGYQIPRYHHANPPDLQYARQPLPFHAVSPLSYMNWVPHRAMPVPGVSHHGQPPNPGRFQTPPSGRYQTSHTARFQLPLPRPSGLRGPWDAAWNLQPPGVAEESLGEPSRKRPVPADEVGRAKDNGGAKDSGGGAKDNGGAKGSALSNGLPEKEAKVAKPASREVPANVVLPDDADGEPERVTFPRELTRMFGPLKCELCSVAVNSTVQAKMHYTGRVHEKKVAAFMRGHAKETGEPLAKRFKEGAPKKKSVGDPTERFCTACNLLLTSKQHADQHYMGRNHKRALQGNAPLKGGYFDKALGKWVRTPPVASDPTGRFHIGKEFSAAEALATDPLALKQVPLAPPDPPLQLRSLFPCELCGVRTTSQDQLDTHYTGAKHKKAVKAAGTAWSLDKQKIPAPAPQIDSILASVVRVPDSSMFDQPLKKDYSIYRTPSGQYYCQPCNYTLNSEAQFGQHCETKKHKQKICCVKRPAAITRVTGKK